MFSFQVEAVENLPGQAKAAVEAKARDPGEVKPQAKHPRLVGKQAPLLSNSLVRQKGPLVHSQ